jgi:hypothetical protein
MQLASRSCVFCNLTYVYRRRGTMRSKICEFSKKKILNPLCRVIERHDDFACGSTRRVLRCLNVRCGGTLRVTRIPSWEVIFPLPSKSNYRSSIQNELILSMPVCGGRSLSGRSGHTVIPSEVAWVPSR